MDVYPMVDDTARATFEDARRRGGLARAEKLSAEQRSAIAATAAHARWAHQADDNRPLPNATHAGVLEIGNAAIPCYVLETGERVLSTRGIMRSLGRTWRGRKYAGTQLPVFLEANNLKPFLAKDLDMVLTPRLFRTERGAVSEGFSAEILPVVCEVYLNARDAGGLTKPQLDIARRCEVLVRALSRVGVIALVDEATGYQEQRDRDELQRILEAYIARELLAWTKRFPDEFYQELFRLRGWQYRPLSVARPQYVGKLTNQLVYEKLPPGVLDELRRKNPVDERTKRRRHKHFQFLTENIGNPHLEKQIVSVTTLMRASPNWAMFQRLFARAFPERQGELALNDEMDAEDGDTRGACLSD